MRYSPVARATSVEYVAASGATVYMGTEAPAGTPALAFVAPDTATAGVTFQATIAASGAASGPWSLNVPSGWTVSPSSGSSVAPGSPVTINVTATEGTQSLTLTCSGATITGNPQSIVVSAAGGGLTVGAQVYTLAATNLSGSGSRPFSATVLPLRGAVPSGERLTDSTGAFDSTVLSTHDDGSAAVVVVSGTASGTGTLNLHRATGSTTALTAAAIGALVTSVEVAFGAPYGTASLTDFSTPERTWWANSKTICARYRVAAPSPGSTALEAVIDVHAWVGRAFVEVVVENCKMLTASPTAPAAASYTGAVVSINGSTVATVNGNGAPEGNHAALRAWYASGWVGGDPGLRVTQSHTDLQSHPLFFRPAADNTADLSTYAADAYTPWTAGRHRASNMGAAGDHPSIGTLPKWETQAIQTGDHRTWQAAEVSALAVLGFGINYRDSATGLVPTFTQLAGKNMQGGSWPGAAYNNAALGWEVPHSPAVGLVAFLSRPSPVFIELAQKVAVWNGMWSTAYGPTPGTPTPGIFGGPYQVRGRAWGMRSLAHAVYLTPDALAWKAAGKTSISANVSYFDGWRTDPKFVLGAMCDGGPQDGDPQDHQGEAGFQQPLWEHHYLAVELHKAASARLLSGADQTALETIAGWACLQPVRWVNEQANGGWRYIPYTTTIGPNSGHGDPGSASTYGTERNRTGNHSDTPVATGSWMGNGPASGPYADYTADTSLGPTYPSYFWAALVAAVERGVANATTAWATVQAGITNLASWLGGAATDPRWGPTPRSGVGWGSGAGTGSYDSGTFTWTPARDGEGLVNAASWALVPTNTIIQVASTRLDALDSVVKAAIPGWYDAGGEDWDGVTDDWNGMAVDNRAGSERLWLACSGGHSGSSNDGIYRFDFRSMTWNVQRLPMNPSYWFAGYPAAVSGGSATPYGPAYDYYLANPTNAEGVYYDEFYDPAYPSDPNRSPRTPTSRHTYGSVVFVPELGAAGKLLMGCRRQWDYDIATNTWALPKAMQGASDPGPVDAGENMNAWWDSTRQRYYLNATSPASGEPRFYWYHPATGTFGTTGYFAVGSYSAQFCGMDTYGGTVYTLSYHNNTPPYQEVNKPKYVVKGDIASGTNTSHTVTLGTSLSGKTFASNNADTHQMCTYVGSLDKLLASINTIEDGEVLCWIDCTTWVAELATFAGISPVTYRLENKMRWLPDIDAVVWVHRASSNVRIIRLS